MNRVDLYSIGQRIKQLRTDAGYTQDYLSEVLEISRPFLSKIENGEKGMSIDLLVRISCTFHVPTDYILFEKGSARDNAGQALDQVIAQLRAIRLLL